MRRSAPRLRLALALSAAAALGCQSYQFNPVGRCVLQLGSGRATLANVSSADVLFVVDDSGSMAGKQAKLAAAFDAFIGTLNSYNQSRVAIGLEPFDFHLAITTTSVFYNPPSSPAATCQATCGSSANVCCVNGSSNPMLDVHGKPVACDPSAVGQPCGQLRETYLFPKNVKPCGSPAPSATGSSTGGQLATGNYFVKVTALYNSTTGIVELAPGAEASASVTGPTGSISVSWAAMTGAQSYKVYLGTATAAENTFFVPASGATSLTITAAGFPGSPGYPPTPCGTSFPTCAPSCGGLTASVGGYCCSAATSGVLEYAPDCMPGVSTDGTPYPQGDFVGLGSNPRVVHYDKQLYATLVNGVWTAVPNPATATNKQGFTASQLGAFFRENVNVGSCGSGEEQGLQAGQLAITKAFAGTQRDTRDASGAYVATGVSAAWPHSGAKLVVVYVGDEDDCSSPIDPARGVILTGVAGNDTCVADAALTTGQKEFPVSSFVGYLQSLNTPAQPRPLGAGFIVSTAQQACADTACTAGVCCDNPCTGNLSCNSGTCGGQAGGSRFLQASALLSQAGADVIDGSVCDPGTAGQPGFSGILSRVAQIVKPPSTLILSTLPAASDVSLLEILQSDGTVRKRCKGPAPAGTTYANATAQGYDWWFTANSLATSPDATAPSLFVYINHATNNCEANPGETYTLEYLGRVPANGCVLAADCTKVLGPGNWTCFAGVDGAGKCIVPTATAAGTCLCGTSAQICPNG